MNGYVAAGYGATLIGLAAYAVHVLHRARTLRARRGADTLQASVGIETGPGAGAQRTDGTGSSTGTAPFLATRGRP